MPTAHWTVTEAVPGRDRPEATEAPSGRVEPGSDLVEMERLGLWVRVETADRRRYWVDGRRLVESSLAAKDDPRVAGAKAGPTPPPPAPPPAPTPAWTATHMVPPEGIQAWQEPDPAGAAANLAGGTKLQVRERRADWACVVAANGWQGWVDGRRLVAVPAAAAQPPPPAPAPAAEDTAEQGKSTTVSLRSVAAVAVVVTIFLPWFTYDRYFGTGDATDIPAAFLWDLYPEWEFPNMGTVMMLVGVAVLVTEFVDRFKPYRRVAAWVTVGVAALYIVQLFRTFLDAEGDPLTALSFMFTEGFAIGPWLALAAGIVLLTKHPEDSTA